MSTHSHASPPVLPFLPGDFPENELTAKIRGLLAELEDAADEEWENLFGPLADLLCGDPGTLVHVLLAANFEALRERDDFKILVAYAYFLLDQLDSAAAICDGVYSSGNRRPFLVDLIVRLLIETGGRGAAQAVLAENPDMLDRYVPLVGRGAALLYLDGRLDEANALSERIHGLFKKGIGNRVNQSMDDILLLSEADRRRFHPEVLDVYSNVESQRDAWLQYQTEMGGGQTRFQNDSSFVNHAYFGGIRRALEEDKGIDTVVNYGSLFGIGDFGLAKSHPHHTVVAYDRAPVAKEMNEPVFRAPNLCFRDGDFAEAVSPLLEKGKTVLGHCRTGTLMYPEDLTRFYRMCHGLGIERLVIGEYVNYGEVDGRYPDFATSNRSSTLMGGHMIQHDYAYYLRKAGYRQYKRTDHPMTCHRPAASHGKVFSEIFQVIEAERISSV